MQVTDLLVCEHEPLLHVAEHESAEHTGPLQEKLRFVILFSYNAKPVQGFPVLSVPDADATVVAGHELCVAFTLQFTVAFCPTSLHKSVHSTVQPPPSDVLHVASQLQ